MGGGGWYGVWVRGIGGEVGIFRENSEKIFEKFRKNFGEMCDDQKTGNWDCAMTK